MCVSGSLNVRSTRRHGDQRPMSSTQLLPKLNNDRPFIRFTGLHLLVRGLLTAQRHDSCVCRKLPCDALCLLLHACSVFKLINKIKCVSVFMCSDRQSSQLCLVRYVYGIEECGSFFVNKYGLSLFNFYKHSTCLAHDVVVRHIKRN